MIVLVRVGVLFLALLCMNGWAREPDHYIAWGYNLVDSGKKIDAYIIRHLQIALEQINRGKHYSRLESRHLNTPHKRVRLWYRSCVGTARTLLRRAFYFPTYQRIEHWLDYHPTIDRFPRRPEHAHLYTDYPLDTTQVYMTNMQYLRNSLLHSMPFWIPLSRVIKVYDIYTGTDKLGHFVSYGARYASKYSRYRNRGYSRESALEKILNYGLWSEALIMGKWTTQALSRGDSEANYQGLLFVLSLCEGPYTNAPYLHYDGTEWRLHNINNFTVQKYVNPNWDESYNVPVYSNWKWRRTIQKKYIQYKYCQKLQSLWVQQLYQFYRSIDQPSINKLYEKKWFNEDPDRHSLSRFCAPDPR